MTWFDNSWWHQSDFMSQGVFHFMCSALTIMVRGAVTCLYQHVLSRKCIFAGLRSLCVSQRVCGFLYFLNSLKTSVQRNSGLKYVWTGQLIASSKCVRCVFMFVCIPVCKYVYVLLYVTVEFRAGVRQNRSTQRKPVLQALTALLPQWRIVSCRLSSGDHCGFKWSRNIQES